MTVKIISDQVRQNVAAATMFPPVRISHLTHLSALLGCRLTDPWMLTS